MIGGCRGLPGCQVSSLLRRSCSTVQMSCPAFLQSGIFETTCWLCSEDPWQRSALKTGTRQPQASSGPTRDLPNLPGFCSGNKARHKTALPSPGLCADPGLRSPPRCSAGQGPGEMEGPRGAGKSQGRCGTDRVETEPPGRLNRPQNPGSSVGLSAQKGIFLPTCWVFWPLQTLPPKWEGERKGQEHPSAPWPSFKIAVWG